MSTHLELKVGQHVAVAPDGRGELHVALEAQASMRGGATGGDVAPHHLASQQHMPAGATGQGFQLLL